MELTELSINYSSKVNENLVCSICCQPYIEAVESPCSHNFCKRCISQALKIKEACPIDRNQLSIDQVRLASNIVQNLVDELEVFCVYEKDGCKLKLQRQYLLDHVKTCPFGKISKEKNNKNDRLDLQVEQDPCKICPHCEEKNKEDELVKHIVGCGQLKVVCKLNKFGCSWSGPQTELPTHNEVCTYLKLESFLLSQDERLKSLEKENQNLKAFLRDLHLNQQKPLTQPLPPFSIPATTTNLNLNLDLNPYSSDPTIDPITPTRPFLHDDLPVASFERFLNQQQRFQFQLCTLSTSLANLELQQNLNLTSEVLGLKDEIHELRLNVQSLKSELNDMSTERQNTLNAFANLAKNASNRVTRANLANGMKNGKGGRLTDYKL